nr:AraC family transcriptional regulator [uncultured Chitinophaga sp.]
MVVFIKNMVCDRCIMVVRQLLEETEIPFEDIQLGEVTISAPVAEEKLPVLKARLQQLGFELLDDKKSTTVERVKNIVIQLIHSVDEVELSQKLSVFLQEKTGMEYTQLSNLFSTVEGTTIEKYVILQRIERAKELLTYNELSVGEIAEKLGYSSIQYLSQQFKKVTGLTTSQFKQSQENQRKPLDKVKS